MEIKEEKKNPILHSLAHETSVVDAKKKIKIKKQLGRGRKKNRKNVSFKGEHETFYRSASRRRQAAAYPEKRQKYECTAVC